MKRTVFVSLATALLTAGAAAEEPISFKDHLGKTIELEGPAERIATIVRSAPVIYYAMDRTTEHLVSVNADSVARIENLIYADLIPELLELNGSAARDGWAPNVEAILAEDPQLVIQSDHSPDLIEPLERVGLKVVAWGCCTEQERLDYITMSGIISGHTERADATLKLHHDSNAAMKAAFASMPEEEFASLLYIDSLDDQIRVVANPSQDFSLSGVNNLAADDTGEWWKTVDLEQLFVWNPEIILIPAYATELNPADFYDHPLLASMNAVKNGRVYKVPKFNSTPDSPELFLTAVWLAMVAHPDMEPVDDDFRATVRNAYSTIYGREPNEEQVASILEIEANSASPGYAELFE